MKFKDTVNEIKARGDQVKRVGIPWFRREDYEDLRKLFVDRDNVFDTFEEWHTVAVRKEGELKAGGSPVVRIILEPKAFAAWCAATGSKPDGQARAAYAGQKAMEQHIGNPQGPAN